MTTYSLLIRWCDQDVEQGEYGWTGQAESPADAEDKARRDMWVNDMADNGDEPYPCDADPKEDAPYGGVVDCHLGAIWRAHELETALRKLLAWEIEQGGWEAPAWKEARDLISSIESGE